MTDAQKKSIPADAETMNALVDGMGAITMVLLSRMPMLANAAADDFAKLAANVGAQGNVTLQKLLLDLERAARAAAPPATN